MALELLDPEATLEFIPESEEGADKPTVIHIRPSGIRDSIKRNLLLVNVRNVSDLKMADTDAIFGYISGRVVKIENITNGTGLTTLTDTKEIKDALERMECPGDFGLDLLVFIITKSKLTGKQEKN